MFAVTFAVIGSVNTSIAALLSLAPAAMPAISTVDVRYQSYNIEMAEVVGGNFWKPYGEKGSQKGDRKSGEKNNKKNPAIPESRPTALAPSAGVPPLQIARGEMF